MSRPKILKQPKNINLIVESDEYEQILKDCGSSFSSYIRDLMRNDKIIETTKTIRSLNDTISKKEEKIRDLENNISNITKELHKSSTINQNTNNIHSLGYEVFCSFCGATNLKLKTGTGRKCRECGKWIE